MDKVSLFVPCFIDQVFPKTAFNAAKVLRKAGVEVGYSSGQTCCGQPAFNSGHWAEARQMARGFLKNFPADHPVVGLSASCAGFFIKNHKDLSASPEIQQEMEQLLPRLYEFSDFLVNKMDQTQFGAVMEARVTYHDACSAMREYGIRNEPRRLLREVKGLELIEMDETEVCCGFGGTFSVKHPTISEAMTARKVSNALRTGAEVIVSTEASCLMSMEGYIRQNKLNIKVMHLADVLASGW